MIRLAIIGGRDFEDWDSAKLFFDRWFFGRKLECIVSGGAVGADAIGARLAKLYDIPLVEYLPDWATYGKRAGFMRNETIIRDCTHVLAFWDGVSKGTKNSLGWAKLLKKPTFISFY
jgi:hypothetical protein